MKRSGDFIVGGAFAETRRQLQLPVGGNFESSLGIDAKISGRLTHCLREVFLTADHRANGLWTFGADRRINCGPGSCAASWRAGVRPSSSASTPSSRRREAQLGDVVQGRPMQSRLYRKIALQVGCATPRRYKSAAVRLPQEGAGRWKGPSSHLLNPVARNSKLPPRSDLTDSTVYWAVTVVTIMPERGGHAREQTRLRRSENEILLKKR